MIDEVRTANNQRVSRYRLDDLKGQDDNPKSHDLAAIERSLRQYGYVEPVALDTLTRRVVAGHGRIEVLRRMRDATQCCKCDASVERKDHACRACKEPRVPKNVAVLDDGEWEIEVVEHRFASKKAARSYVVASNRTSELGGWAENYTSYLGQFVDDAALVSAMSIGDAEYAKLTARQDALAFASRLTSEKPTEDASNQVSTQGEPPAQDRVPSSSDVEEETITLSFVVTLNQQSDIERALKKMCVRERAWRGNLLAAICREWTSVQEESDEE